MFKMKSMEDIYNHIGYVVLCAPDRFPIEDYLRADEQMNLDRAFEQLQEGVTIAYPDDFHPEKRAPLNSLLEMSLAAYRSGDDVEGVRLLQEFQDNIFKHR